MYRVSFGDEWITWKLSQPADVLKRAVVEARHFGDVLQADTLREPVVEYAVEFSKGVKPVADGWQFTAVRDVPLGLFLGDLRRRFGPERITCPTPHLARIDLSGVSADQKGEINLDPTVAPTFTGRHETYGTESDEQDAWDAAHDAAVSDTTYDTFGVQARCNFIPGPNIYQAVIDRLGLQFDTSAYGEATAAKLVLAESSVTGTPGIVYNTMSIADVTAPEAYPDILAAATGGYEITDQGATWESGDLVGLGLFAASATFQLGLIETNDDLNTIPASDQVVLWSDGYLEISMPAAGGVSSTSTSTGRGRLGLGFGL